MEKNRKGSVGNFLILTGYTLSSSQLFIFRGSIFLMYLRDSVMKVPFFGSMLVELVSSVDRRAVFLQAPGQMVLEGG